MNLAIFGGGSIGQRHARNAKALGCEVDIYDSDPPRGKSIWQFSGADAVLVCTPASTHEAVAADLSRMKYAGPLFVEKPIALSSAAPIFREWPHPVTMVGYNWRFHPELAPLRELARRGATVHFDCRTDMRTWPGAQYGDPVLECSHEVDLACDWLGDPASIIGGDLAGGGAWLQMQQPHGDSIVDVHWQAENPRRAIGLYARDHVTTIRVQMQRSIFNLSPVWPALDESYVLELQHFLDCVRTKQPTACPFSQGLRVIEICEHVKRMAA